MSATDHPGGPAVPEGASAGGDGNGFVLPANTNLPSVLTPQELAGLLRMRPRSVYQAIQRGDLPGVRRIGRKIRVDRDTVLRSMPVG